MISIIVLTYRSDMMESLRQNIAETIGLEYELIEIDNGENKYSITSAYNEGGRKARFDILCFAHEDIYFRSQNWGREILNAFSENESLALAGVAGSQNKSQLPTGWTSGLSGWDLAHIYHQRPNGDIQPYSIGGGSNVKPARVIDGVFMSVRRNIWEETRFDESITGFHFYDLDFSLRISLKYAVAVLFTFDLIHRSAGNFGTEWISRCLQFHRKSNIIKYSIAAVSPKERGQIRAFWYNRLQSERISFRQKIQYSIRMGIDWHSKRQFLQFIASRHAGE